MTSAQFTSYTSMGGADYCLGHPSFTYIYHYHFMPPCIANPNLNLSTGIVACSNNTACKADVRTYSESAYTSAGKNTLQPIGIAKDGFIIYGPYDANGNLWKSCDVDICNGLWING